MKIRDASPRVEKFDVPSGFDILRAPVVPLWELLYLYLHAPGLELVSIVECYGGYESVHDKPVGR